MTLPMNIEDLLRQRTVKSNRIELRQGCNPDRVYCSICAFANVSIIIGVDMFLSV